MKFKQRSKGVFMFTSAPWIEKWLNVVVIPQFLWVYVAVAIAVAVYLALALAIFVKLKMNHIWLWIILDTRWKINQMISNLINTIQSA